MEGIGNTTDLDSCIRLLVFVIDVVNDCVRQQITDTLNQKLETVELSAAVKVTGGSGIICLNVPKYVIGKKLKIV